MKSLTPQIKAIQERYAGDQVKKQFFYTAHMDFICPDAILSYVCINF